MANKNFQVKHGLEVGTTVTADAATGNITTSGDVAVNGGDLTTTAVTANVVNANAATVNLAGAATAVNIGANTGTLTVGNPTVVGTQATQNLYNTVATTLNLGGAATAVSIGAATGTTTINNANTVVTGDLAVNGGDITTTATGTATVFNTNATTLNVGGAATAVSIGAATGTTTINNANTVVTGDLAVNGGDITTNQTTFNLLNTTATTLNVGGGATTAVNIGNSSGEIITPSDVQQTGNKSFRQGNGPYTGSTDIFRDATGAAVEGYLATNNGMTSVDTAFVSRNYGQNYPSSTTATAGPGKIYLGGTRGTPASPLANNAATNIGQVSFFSNFGDTTGGGTGNGWSNDLFTINAQPAGTIAFAGQNHRQTLQATFTGSISGTTLTVTAVTSGTIAPGQEIRGTGFNQFLGAFTITRQLSSTAPSNALGSTGTYEINASPGTIGSSTMTTYSITGGTGIRTYVQAPNVPLNTSTVANFNMAPALGTGVATYPLSNNNFTQSWWTFPQNQRIIREITGGNTLNIGTHGLNATSGSFTIVTAGNPNGLITGTTYFIDSIPSPTTITLRTNSGGGGAVTGLTNGSGLFIEARIEAESSTGGQAAPSAVTVQGFRRGHNFAGVATQDNTRQNDWLGQYNFAGGFSNSTTNTNTRIFATATEDWAVGSKFGSQINFNTVKTGTTTGYISSIGASNTVFVTDSFVVQNTSFSNMLTADINGNVTVTGDLQVVGNDIRASDNNTNITMNSNTLTTFAGDIRVNGNDIQAGDGNINMSMNSNILTTFSGDIRINGNDIQNSTGNTTITMNSGANATSIFAGDIRVNGNDIINSAGNSNITLSDNNTTIRAVTTQFYDNATSQSNIQFKPGNNLGATISDRVTQFGLFHRRNPATPLEYPNAGFNNWILDSGTGNYSPNLSGEILGELNYSGQYSTTSTPAGNGPAVSFSAKAAENFSATANGGRGTITTTKIGTASTKVDVVSVDTSNAYIRSDNLYFQNSSSTPLTSAAINYTRTYGEFAYTNAAGFAIAAQNTIYTMPLDTTLNNSGVTISGTGEININVSGWYKIIMSLQITLTVSNQPGQIDFWLRKNGVDVANSKTQVDLLKDQKAVIAMDWLVNSDGNDYWEIVYVGTTANYADIDFPTIAATTTPYVSPLAPALIVNVIPAGA